MAIVTSITPPNSSFPHVRDWFNENLHPDKLNLDDEHVYDSTYNAGKFVSIFQFTGCLAGGTHVTMSNGTIKPIEQVKVGDDVLTFDTTTRQFTVRPVPETFDHGPKECIEVQFEPSVPGVLHLGTSIVCTPNHEFYTSNRGWVRADELTPDDDVIGLGD